MTDPRTLDDDALDDEIEINREYQARCRDLHQLRALGRALEGLVAEKARRQGQEGLSP